MESRQSPILAVVRTPARAARSVWRQEAEAMRDVGKGLRATALSLPCDSSLRVHLLEEAEDWLLQARMRGLPFEAASA